MGKKDKSGYLELPEKAIRIIQYYDNTEAHSDQTIFPELRNIDLTNSNLVQKKIRNADRKFNKHLASIANEIELNKPLKMHIARHTFGNISGDRIPIQMLQKLYRHTSVTTTIGYQANFIFRDTKWQELMGS